MIAQYCIIRADLPTGLKGAMLIHAARESSVGIPHNPHEYAIALQARDESHLEEISFMLFREGIAHRRIIESDAPWTGQLMALGISPALRDPIRRLLSSLPTMK